MTWHPSPIREVTPGRCYHPLVGGNPEGPLMAISRRKFLATVGTTGAAVTIVPRHVLGRGLTPPSDRLNIAGIGVGGMGKTNLLNLGVENNIVALCDADWDYAGKAWGSLPDDLAREEGRLPKVTDPTARTNSLER